MDLFHYTFLKNHGFLDKFRAALNYPALSLSCLNALLKTFNSRHKLVRFIVPDDKGKMTLFYKDTLNYILNNKILIEELNRYLDEWDAKDVEKHIADTQKQTTYIDTNDASDDEDMQKVSDKLIWNDNYQEVDEAIDEKGTNISILYHFTSINALESILHQDFLKASSNESSLRHNKNFISFTRYKNAKEGINLSLHDVRITVDSQKLNSIHNKNIYPFDFFSGRERINSFDDERFSDVERFFDKPFEAEESFETEKQGIFNFHNYVIRIDIYNRNRKALDYLVTPYYINKIYVYDNPKDYIYQTNNCHLLSNKLDTLKKVDESKRMKGRKIYLTESQFDALMESYNFVDPEKVKIVAKYLDENFVRGGISCIGEDGYPTTVEIVAIKGTDGKLAKNMNAKQLFYLLQDKFQHIYNDKDKRDKFLKQVIKDWYAHKISKEGLLSVNKY
jgi:hypothetical protein